MIRFGAAIAAMSMAVERSSSNQAPSLHSTKQRHHARGQSMGPASVGQSLFAVRNGSDAGCPTPPIAL